MSWLIKQHRAQRPGGCLRPPGGRSKLRVRLVVAGAVAVAVAGGVGGRGAGLLLWVRVWGRVRERERVRVRVRVRARRRRGVAAAPTPPRAERCWPRCRAARTRRHRRCRVRRRARRWRLVGTGCCAVMGEVLSVGGHPCTRTCTCPCARVRLCVAPCGGRPSASLAGLLKATVSGRACAVQCTDVPALSSCSALLSVCSSIGVAPRVGRTTP